MLFVVWCAFMSDIIKQRQYVHNSHTYNLQVDDKAILSLLGLAMGVNRRKDECTFVFFIVFFGKQIVHLTSYNFSISPLFVNKWELCILLETYIVDLRALYVSYRRLNYYHNICLVYQ